MKGYASRAGQTPLKALLNFKLLLKKTKPLLPEVKVPTLVVQGLKDDIVRAKSADYIYQHLGAEKKLIEYFPGSGHLICRDWEQDRVLAVVTRFIQDLI